MRTSLGGPRWISEATGWPVAKELAPKGFKNVADPAKFRRLYREKMNDLGKDAVASLLGGIYLDQKGVRLPLALLCFEDIDVSWCHRTFFAEWWFDQTGDHLIERNTAELLAASDLLRAA